MIRHENIALFMGVCRETPRLAIVMRCMRTTIFNDWWCFRTHTHAHTYIYTLTGFSLVNLHFLSFIHCPRWSACKGISLYDHLHVFRSAKKKVSRAFPFRTLLQLAQAVNYLHSRVTPILVRRLNSHTVFLEPKVVLSLMDDSYSECDYKRWVKCSVECRNSVPCMCTNTKLIYVGWIFCEKG